MFLFEGSDVSFTIWQYAFELCSSQPPLSISVAGKAMWDRLTAPEDGFSKLQRENLAIIESYGKALMDVVCRDACDGHEMSRVWATPYTYFANLSYTDIILTWYLIS